MSTEQPTPVRWRTSWLVLFGCLLFSVCAFAYSGFEYQEAVAFEQDHHEVAGIVVDTDCWVACKSGPIVDVSYRRIDGRLAVGRLARVSVHYRVGTTLTVVYSDGAAADGDLSLPTEVKSFRHLALGYGIAGGAGLILAFAAWAFPANLRRLDRLDATQVSA